MPQIPFSRTLIELPVSDRVVADTIIKQKARFTNLSHSQSADGVCSARVTVQVTMYAAAGEGYGPELNGAGFSARIVELSAANDTLVDAASEPGRVLAIRQGENEAAWKAIIDSFPQPTMLQGDFFEYLRENQAIEIGALIRQHITQADALGRFA